MKEPVEIVDATPSKRLYLSIIADYDINRSLCELVDNAIDLWTVTGRSADLVVEVILDRVQQRILVRDNAGGIEKSDLSYVVSPGQSKSSGDEKLIGVFGVGSKRAVVALAQDIKIRTRKGTETFQIDIDDRWIEHNDEWSIPVYKVNDIDIGSTEIELVRLRKPLDADTERALVEYFSTTYAIFLKDSRLSILVNKVATKPVTFENWAFPPEYEPRNYVGELPLDQDEHVSVLVTAGLCLESSQAEGDYGVFVYCNDRLVARGLKSVDVGYATGFAGKPHTEISLARVLVHLNGPARLMPWNSSKSDINASHEVFRALRSWLMTVVKDFSGLSRRFSKAEGGWPENVFKYPKGKFIDQEVRDLSVAHVSYLPPLPEAKPRYSAIVQRKNRHVAEKKPWTTGLYETMIATDWVLKQHLEQRNRIALILLDSTLEIAFKEYLVNDSGKQYSDDKVAVLFKNRHEVHKEMESIFRLPEGTWKKIKHYYQARCDLVHRKATTSIGDKEISEFRRTVEMVLRKLYSLQFER